MININEEIRKEENNNQFYDNLSKTAAKLKGKNWVNMTNMWELIRKLKQRSNEPQTAIKSKYGYLIEEAEEIKQRYHEQFKNILATKPAVSEREKIGRK